jgi:hydroxyacylglutathione hydrolase
MLRNLNLTRIQVNIIPILQDNYAYLLVHEPTNKALLVDPAEPDTILPYIKSRHTDLIGIVCTHHHWDHAGGNEAIKRHFPNIKVYGGDPRIPELNRLLEPNQELTAINLDPFCFSFLSTPCHTRKSICLLFASMDDRLCLFTGDTLFSYGCGRFFEGTPHDMLSAMDKISNLPHDTLVYPGHEYTKKNIRFALNIVDQDLYPAYWSKLDETLKSMMDSSCTIPSTLEQELQMNPFMRTRCIDLQTLVFRRENDTQVGLGEDERAITAMGLLRSWKDNF